VSIRPGRCGTRPPKLLNRSSVHHIDAPHSTNIVLHCPLSLGLVRPRRRECDTHSGWGSGFEESIGLLFQLFETLPVGPTPL